MAVPHLLFLLSDDLGYNDVSYHNGQTGPGATWTPHIDALAHNSTILESYYGNPARVELALFRSFASRAPPPRGSED